MKLDCAEGSILSYSVRCADGKCDTDAWPELYTRNTKEELEGDENIECTQDSCTDCQIFECSQGRLTRVRGNNTILVGSYQEGETAVSLVVGKS